MARPVIWPSNSGLKPDSPTRKPTTASMDTRPWMISDSRRRFTSSMDWSARKFSGSNRPVGAQMPGMALMSGVKQKFGVSTTQPKYRTEAGACAGVQCARAL